MDGYTYAGKAQAENILSSLSAIHTLEMGGWDTTLTSKNLKYNLRMFLQVHDSL